MANSAFDHSASITVPGSSTNTALVTWSGTGADTLGNSTILVGATTMGLAADTDLLTFGNGTIAITGAVTGVTALTASGAVTGGTLVGTVTTATQNSITTMTGLATVTASGVVTGGTLAGTVSTATQNSITTMTGLTTVGTVGTGVWNGTAIITTYGGTGLASYTAGDMFYYASGTTLTKLAKGTADQVLTMNDGATAPGWEDAAAGGATLSGSTNNTVVTVTGSNAMIGETGLTFNAGVLTVDSGATNVSAIVSIEVNASATSDPMLRWREGSGNGDANNQQYEAWMDVENGQFRFRSQNIDGSSSEGDVWTINDGTNDVKFNGDVGIGTQPSHKLHVEDPGGWLAFLNATTNTGQYSCLYAHTASEHSDTSIAAFHSGSSYKFMIRGNGNVTNGASTTYHSYSDERIKENIVDSTYGLTALMALRPVKFNYQSWYEENTSDRIGFIAQEVKVVIPGIVKVNEDPIKVGDNNSIDDMHSIEDQQLIPILVKAIQELKAEIDELKG